MVAGAAESFTGNRISNEHGKHWDDSGNASMNVIWMAKLYIKRHGSNDRQFILFQFSVIVAQQPSETI